MRFKDFLGEMAKRVTPADFYKMAVKKYGTDKVRAITMGEVVAVAKENDVQVPGYVVKNKIGRARFDLLPKDAAPEPKQAPAPVAAKEPEKKVVAKPAAKEVTDETLQNALRDMRSRMRDQTKYDQFARWGAMEKDEPSGFMMDVRDWGNWQNPEDAYDEEDYDWQILSVECRKLLDRLVLQVQQWYPGVDLRYSVEEKNYITISTRKR